ncbi:MAG: PQQ-binding-like beta-propeller repeat protein, partial [Fervidobacterium sp.]
MILVVFYFIASCAIHLTEPELSIEMAGGSLFVNGEVSFLIKVRENFIISKVLVYLNDALLLEENVSKSYYEKEVKLNSANYKDGEYTLKVLVYNNQNASTERRMKFYFDNTPPSVQLVPFQNKFVNSVFKVKYELSENIAIDTVALYLDGKLLTEKNVVSEFEVDSTKFSEGEHVISVRAKDKVGLVSEASDTIVFDNTPPDLVVDDSTIADKLYGKVKITANSTDNFGVRKVVVKVVDENVAELDKTPYVFELDTTKFPNGYSKISVIALDYAGNSKTWTKDVRIINPSVLNWKLKVSTKPVYGVAFDGEKIYASSGTGVHAITVNGSLMWRFESRLAASFKAAPVIGAAKVIYCVTDKGEVYAIDNNGKQIWFKSGVGDSIESSPAFSSRDKLLIFGNNEGKIYTLKAEDGVILNTYVTPDRYSIYSSPAINSEGTVYFLGRDNYFYAVYNSNLKWRVIVGNFIGTTSSSPAIDLDNRYIYIGSNNGKFYCISDQGSSGNILWSFDTKAPIVSSPVIGNDGKVYICNSNGKLFCFEKTGTKVFEKDLEEKVSLTPVIGVDGKIYVPTDNGSLVCLNAEGNVEWTY